jgi:hypothetical protein
MEIFTSPTQCLLQFMVLNDQKLENYSPKTKLLLEV